jgi:hypothetical protein
MSIYTCPHCGEKTFTPMRKAMAGNMKSKGKPCPKCGKLCVNGKSATTFDAIYCLAAFVLVIYIYLNGTKNEWWYYHEMPMVMGLVLSMFIVPRIAHAFFFKLTESIRLDAYK